MRRMHPLSVLAYFVFSIILTAFSADLATALIAIAVGATVLAVMKKKAGSAVLAAIFSIAVCAAVNPLFSSRGATELLFINGRAVTLEAVIEGAKTGSALGAAICLCLVFSEMFDPSSVLFLLGKRAPKCAVVLGSAMRFFPELIEKHGEIRRAQKGLGRMPEDRFSARVKGETRAFSALIESAVREAEESAHLMVNMGFDPNGERTPSEKRRFRARDIALTAASAVLFIAAVTPYAPISYPAAAVLFLLPIFCFKA